MSDTKKPTREELEEENRELKNEIEALKLKIEMMKINYYDRLDGHHPL